MELTQQDFDTRNARVQDGTGDDEDRRLVKHYLAEGFTPGDKQAGAGAQPGTESGGKIAAVPAVQGDTEQGDQSGRSKSATGRTSSTGKS